MPLQRLPGGVDEWIVPAPDGLDKAEVAWHHVFEVISDEDSVDVEPSALGDLAVPAETSAGPPAGHKWLEPRSGPQSKRLGAPSPSGKPVVRGDCGEGSARKLGRHGGLEGASAVRMGERPCCSIRGESRMSSATLGGADMPVVIRRELECAGNKVGACRGNSAWKTARPCRQGGASAAGKGGPVGFLSAAGWGACHRQGGR